MHFKKYPPGKIQTIYWDNPIFNNNADFKLFLTKLFNIKDDEEVREVIITSECINVKICPVGLPKT